MTQPYQVGCCCAAPIFCWYDAFKCACDKSTAPEHCQISCAEVIAQFGLPPYPNSSIVVRVNNGSFGSPGPCYTIDLTNQHTRPSPLPPMPGTLTPMASCAGCCPPPPQCYMTATPCQCASGGPLYFECSPELVAGVYKINGQCYLISGPIFGTPPGGFSAPPSNSGAFPDCLTCCNGNPCAGANCPWTSVLLTIPDPSFWFSDCGNAPNPTHLLCGRFKCNGATFPLIGSGGVCTWGGSNTMSIPFCCNQPDFGASVNGGYSANLICQTSRWLCGINFGIFLGQSLQVWHASYEHFGLQPFGGYTLIPGTFGLGAFSNTTTAPCLNSPDFTCSPHFPPGQPPASVTISN